MRITDIYLSGYGPFIQKAPLRLNVDDERVLFLGVSGSGKSTLFRAAQALWEQAERCGAGEPPLPMGPGRFALAIDGLPFGRGVLAWGSEDFARQILAAHPGAKLLLIQKDGFSGDWPPSPLPDASLLADTDPVDWVSLITRCPEAIEAANQLLVGKALTVNGGLQVRLANGVSHGPELLSLGEQRICHLCALAGALRPGGLLLLDEPDVHLHPSQSLGLMATLENLVLDKEGGMWIISHREELWQRYEDVGLVVTLSREVPHA